ISSRQPSGRRHMLSMTGVHTVFGNLKTWLTGRFHGVSPKYLGTYLAEFTYRFNRLAVKIRLDDAAGWVRHALLRDAARRGAARTRVSARRPPPAPPVPLPTATPTAAPPVNAPAV